MGKVNPTLLNLATHLSRSRGQVIIPLSTLDERTFSQIHLRSIQNTLQMTKHLKRCLSFLKKTNSY